ncbi:DNA-DIRECTED RNA POLYMERASE III 34kDa SUBUNIT [Encephalitozoon cuniculi GB-M1]|uniref:DNA-directed RNA polymerase III subunit RPC6 n=2 Tax=Encephalitozoon cuniculi TaxID=6035 RepID=Q8SR78_ENCCU|nr:DNA-directed RNA polymerase III subunit C34 [Encephalitozoon cuniculi GB-M1]AGE96487.1 DNA-directed RNA polymerase III 34kDa subunit [Encephalitozoon cuniculi]KMV65172.1 DNA-directed RNA polymerase III subunit C34 [Encephalitozoon cuniculi EcunIII-L]UYI26477.1 RNA polymerase subunit [Encephalitozoon cuniculi]CAD25740.1 DNA-DIRECTED RNA POLYMERASE III 34kDa SUBUNIT [Encephalitozoon cuniculi GB-M1]
MIRGILDFIRSRPEGVVEEELSSEFPQMSKADVAKELNACLKRQEISLFRDKGVLYYKPSPINVDDYELTIYNLVSQSGGEGVWLKVIKDKTNMPHNLVGKVLRSMESKRIIKSVKCLKNNRKVYVLYDQVPSEEITGGTWFHDNDVDVECVARILEIIELFLEKNLAGREELPKYEDNPTLEDIMNYVRNVNILSIPLRLDDLETLADILVFDGKVEKLHSGPIARYRAFKPYAK